MSAFLTAAFHVGLAVLAVRVTAWFAALVVAWVRLLPGRGAGGDAESEKIIASQMTVPITFVLIPGDEERAEPFLDRLSAALAIRYPNFEVIAAIPATQGDLARNAAKAFDLKRINVVFRKVFETPPVTGVHKTPRHKNLTVVHLDGRRRGDLLNAAVNLSTYPLLFLIQGTPAADSVTALMVPFVRNPGDCACAVGAIAPDSGDRRSGGFWLDNAGRLLGATVAPRHQIGNGLPEVSLLIRKDSVIAAGGFARTGRYEGVLRAVTARRTGPRRLALVTRRAGVSTVHGGGGWAAKEWALGRNVCQRLGTAAAIISILPPLFELGAWGAAAAAWGAGAISAPAVAFFVVLAAGAGAFLRAMSFLYEELTFAVHRRAGKLAATSAAIVVEHAGPRQVILAIRVLSRITGLLRRD